MRHPFFVTAICVVASSFAAVPATAHNAQVVPASATTAPALGWNSIEIAWTLPAGIDLGGHGKSVETHVYAVFERSGGSMTGTIWERIDGRTAAPKDLDCELNGDAALRCTAGTPNYAPDDIQFDTADGGLSGEWCSGIVGCHPFVGRQLK